MPYGKSRIYRSSNEYRKQYSIKRRPNRRRVPRSKNAIAKYASYGMQAYKLATKLASLVNVEEKIFSNNYSFNVGYDGNDYYQLNAIPQGDTDVTRDGDSCKIQRVSINGHIGINGSASQTVVRILLFWDDDANLTAANFWTNLSTAYAVDSHKNHDYRFKSKMLIDKKFSLTTNDGVAMIDMNAMIGRHTQFNAGTTTINSGSLRLLVLSDQAINEPAINLVTTVYFTDN